MPLRRTASVVLLVLCTSPLVAAGCGAAGRAPAEALPEPAPPPAEPIHFPYALAWTARADVPIRSESGEQRVEHPFTRLNVTAVDTLGVRVQCLYCIPAVDGWVRVGDLVYEPAAPAEVAAGELAEFVLAVRAAAEARDEAALRPVMSQRFTFSFEGGGGGVDAFRRWEWQGFRALDNLVPLLDRGLATRDSVIWTAPPAFLTDPGYHGLRAGFRRSPEGRWEWIYLVGR